MPINPDGYQLRVSRPLTNISVAWMQDQPVGRDARAFRRLRRLKRGSFRNNDVGGRSLIRGLIGV